MKNILKIFLILLFYFQVSTTFSQGEKAEKHLTQVVLLGTGNPNPTPDRLGPATAIVVGDRVYLVDVGIGVTRAVEAARANGVEVLTQENLTTAFLTHIHSDHTLGISDLMNTPWVLGRTDPLRVYGPPGVIELVEHTLKAYEGDIEFRTKGTQPSNNSGWVTTPIEIKPGLIFDDNQVKVFAFEVCHGEIVPSFGFRFETPDKVIVISGDTTFCPNLIQAAKGADILIHEVYSNAGFEKLPDDWKKYHAAHHTSASDVAKIATEIKPELLILTHHLQWGGLPYDLILEEVKKEYEGKIAFGNDGDVY